MDIIQKIRSRYSDFNFTTDVIVGFPGETEEEFRETCNVIPQAGFSHIHTFKYSRRTGTRADRFPDQISEKIKNDRSKTLRDIADKMKLDFRKGFIGKEQTLLVERNNSKGGARGYGESYLPIVVKGEKLQRNDFYRVKIVDVLDNKDLILFADLD
jgi:threonylcarbamoyladenosine tRNA methylthiotransferase MtaB